MNEIKRPTAGERTQSPPVSNEFVSEGCEQFTGHDEIQAEQQSENLGSERGGYLFNGRTAKEWHQLHEVIRQDYGRVIGELEAMDKLANELKDERNKLLDQVNTLTNAGQKP